MPNTREIATQILSDIYDKTGNFEKSISQNIYFKTLDSRDKSFIRFLILNTLRRNGQIQKVIDDLTKKPIRKKDSFILNLLRISICQILFLDIKEYSIVNTAVEIAKNYKRDKFVNGLLRNVCRNKNEINKSSKIESNIPNWMREDIIKFLGKEKLLDISKAVVKEPFTDIKVKKNYLSKNNWEKLLNAQRVTVDTFRTYNSGLIEKKPFFKEGVWWIQSISATLPVNIISSIFKKINHSTVSILDVGAAPGGKTFQLIEKKFDVTSLEISEKRIKILEENLRRLNFDTKIICDDFIKFKRKVLFDCVLIDAPCSASGLIQKKPEILLSNKLSHLNELIKKQRKMLEKSSILIKKGGYIIYCVCSIHSKEGFEIIKEFLGNNKKFKTVDIDSKISKFGQIIKPGMLLILPDNLKVKGGLDGFFIAVLNKVR